MSGYTVVSWVFKLKKEEILVVYVGREVGAYALKVRRRIFYFATPGRVTGNKAFLLLA